MIPDPRAAGQRRPNPFAGGVIDRAAERRRDAEWVRARADDPEARLIPVWRSRSLVVRRGERDVAAALLTTGEAGALVEGADEWVFLGLLGGRPLFAAEVRDAAADAAHLLAGPGRLAAADDAPPELARFGELHDLHRVGAMMEQGEGSLLAYARALVTWNRSHRFCGRCGARTEPRDGGHVRRCTNAACAREHFPRTDPAIIVLVEDGDRCLLGRKSVWPDGVYSTLAGFVEPGESLSEAVAREVFEESGIVVGGVRYRSSQPWPFPSSLMLGFHAEAEGGELRIDRVELSDARWFHRDEVRARREIGLKLPSRVSIARRLIEDWLAGL
jgi:NAD+ diphosphatase